MYIEFNDKNNAKINNFTRYSTKFQKQNFKLVHLRRFVFRYKTATRKDQP